MTDAANDLKSLAINYKKVAIAYAQTIEAARQEGSQLGYDLAANRHSASLANLRREIAALGGEVAGNSVLGTDKQIMLSWE